MAIAKKRRALTHVGGPVETWGAKDLASVAHKALDVSADEARTMAHVHGFHSYPARLHPETAARLIEGLSQPGAVVLDPFCGSGSVLVEARRLGRRGLGVDANPLAIELSWLKTRAFDENELSALTAAASRVAEHADDRRLAKAGPTRRYGAVDRDLFDVHVLLELDGLSSGLSTLPPGDIRRALWIVLSAVLGKVSRRLGDTSEGETPRRLAGGFTIRFFLKKTDDLVRRITAYRALLGPEPPPVELSVGDARHTGIARHRVALVVSSPPYPGVYDYYLQHEARLRWLGLDSRRFEREEIGSRRRSKGRDHHESLASWSRELGACIEELERVLARSGVAALVIADSAVGGRAVRADALVGELASRHKLTLAARASQARPHFHGPSQAVFRSAPRKEHILILSR